MGGERLGLFSTSIGAENFVPAGDENNFPRPWRRATGIPGRRLLSFLQVVDEEEEDPGGGGGGVFAAFL